MPVTITQLGSTLKEWRLDQYCEITDWAFRLKSVGFTGTVPDIATFLAHLERDLWTRGDTIDEINAFLDAMKRGVSRPGTDELRLGCLYQVLLPHLCRLLAVPTYAP